MKRPDFDNMTEKEKRQLGDYVNANNSRTYAAMLRRRKIAEAKNKIESEAKDDY